MRALVYNSMSVSPKKVRVKTDKMEGHLSFADNYDIKPE